MAKISRCNTGADAQPRACESAVPLARVRWPDSGFSAALLAALLFASASLVLFGLRVLDGFSSSYVGANGPDPKLFIWSMEWWSGPAFRSLNPFHADVIWAPAGYDLTWATTVPGPAVLVAPVTRIFGPIAGYNVLVLAAPVMAAMSAFALCMTITRRVWPSIAGGYSFGFSSYMLAHMRGGHLNLLLVFPLLLLALVVLLALRGKIGTSRVVIATTALLTTQFLISTEVFATAIVIGGLALVLAYPVAEPGRRRSMRRLLPALIAAFLCTLILVSPFLLAAFVGPIPEQVIDKSAGSTDVLNLMAPTSVTWLGGRALHSISGRFSGSVAGQGAYVALPLLLAAGSLAWRQRRRFEGKFLAGVFIGGYLLSLGPTLKVGGERTWIPGPGIVLDVLPLIGKALPGRMFLYSLIALAVLIALWLSTPGASVWRWTLVLAGFVLLLPAPRDWMWSTTPEVPPFFSDGGYQTTLRPGENVLVLSRTSALALVWQAEANLEFSMPAAYTGGRPIAADPTSKAQFFYRQQCPQAYLSRSFQEDLRHRGVTHLLVPDSGKQAEGCPVPIIEGARMTTSGGVLVYRLGE